MAVVAHGSIVIEAEAPGAAFEAGSPVVIGVRGVSAEREWELRRWTGDVLSRGRIAVDGCLDLGCLPEGYYRIGFPMTVEPAAGHVAFAVVPKESDRVRLPPDSIYGVDAAFSWCCGKSAFQCPWMDGDTHGVILRLMRLAGVVHVRERMSWRESSPERGVYTYGRYLSNARRLHEQGFRISCMVDDAPQFAKRLEKLPSDLVVLYDFCRNTGKTFGGLVDAFEFWNEPDIGFAPEPVWDYVSALKAAHLGFKDGAPSITVAPGAMCQYLRGNYERLEYANGMAMYSDVFNLHTYTPLSEYPRQQGDIRDCLVQNGVADVPVWITESGTDSEGDAEATGVIKGRRAHSPEQELLVAEFFAKSGVLFAQEGVARNYCFIFTAYNERGGRKDWGFLRADGSVKPSYTVLATQTKVLGGKKLLGEIRLADGVRAFLYEGSKGDQTLAVWTVSKLEKSRGHVRLGPRGAQTIRLPVGANRIDVTDMCGFRRAVTCPSGVVEIEISRYPVYLSGLRGLSCDVQARRTGRIPVRRPDSSFDARIVVRVDLNREDFRIADRKCRADLQGETGRMTLHVWNLDTHGKSGRLICSGGSLHGLPEEIYIPAMSETAVEVVYAPTDDARFKTDFRIGGRFDGRSISEWMAPVWLRGRFLSRCHRKRLNAGKVENWARNDSSDGYSIEPIPDGMSFKADWKAEIDRWFYPTYTLSAAERQVCAAADFLEFDVRAKQDKIENDFSCQVVYVLYENSGPMSVGYAAPVAEWERRTIDLTSVRRSGDTIIGFRLGCNPKGKRLRYEVRDVQLLVEPQPGETQERGR